MDSAWGPRKSARTQGEGAAPSSSSKLVQLQRQSSFSSSTLLSSPISLSSAPSSSSTLPGSTISGGALDFGSGSNSHNNSNSISTSNSSSSHNISSHGLGSNSYSRSELGYNSKLGASSSTGDLGGLLSSGGSGAGSSGLTGSGSGLGAGTDNAPGTGVGALGTSVTGPAATQMNGSLHPLHFNWVFWFMHRAPGSKIVNYEGSMKKIATFGSIMAVVGDQFDVGSEICGAVLSIRGGEDILSLWNQSAHEGRINLKIRDTMKRVLNLPMDTIMEYKSHNDALRDNSSFRNTDVFR
ncbi:Eukaryotic translation initiation factor 4E type 2 [Mortierella sp. NVP85]|nr:Eukaryotic translation initiation factor 4E type 2 [Mortierella sp. NVP85]